MRGAPYLLIEERAGCRRRGRSGHPVENEHRKACHHIPRAPAVSLAARHRVGPRRAFFPRLRPHEAQCRAGGRETAQSGSACSSSSS